MRKKKNRYCKICDKEIGRRVQYCEKCKKERIRERKRKYRQQNKEKLNERERKYYHQNREKVRKREKRYQQQNKEKISEKKKEYYQQNKEKIKERRMKKYQKNKIYRKEYVEKIKEKNRKRNKEYYKKNKEKILEKMKKYGQTPEYKKNKREYCKKRMEDNPIFRLNSNISRAIHRSLKQNNLSKNGSHWENLVGYKVQELRAHLEKLFLPGMTWENYGEWHIDHIIPISFFKYKSTDDVEFRMCWRLENLQPLWKKKNLEKGNKLILKYIMNQ